MTRNNTELTARLVELRNAIKKKYRQFKEGAVESDIMLEKQYKPIIEELRKTTTTPDIKTEQETYKAEPVEESMESNVTDSEEGEFAPQTVSTPKPQNLTEILSTPTGFQSASTYVDKYVDNELTKEYMYDLFKDPGGKNRKIDHDYGPYFENETLKLGDKQLDFDKMGNILIGGTNYGKSEGLYELIFKRTPDANTYTTKDLETYKSILTATNAHKENYDFHSKIRRNSSLKYRSIIKLLFPTTRGKGMAWKYAKSNDVIYWDNVNELVDRLRHIAMSTETGNRVHSNEILSIIEELREAGYIKGVGNSRFKSLLK